MKNKKNHTQYCIDIKHYSEFENINEFIPEKGLCRYSIARGSEDWLCENSAEYAVTFKKIIKNGCLWGKSYNFCEDCLSKLYELSYGYALDRLHLHDNVQEVYNSDNWKWSINERA